MSFSSYMYLLELGENVLCLLHELEPSRFAEEALRQVDPGRLHYRELFENGEDSVRLAVTYLPTIELCMIGVHLPACCATRNRSILPYDDDIDDGLDYPAAIR